MKNLGERKIGKLKAGDNFDFKSNVETIKQLFGITVNKNRHGGYKLKEGKWAAFIYIVNQSPDGNWMIPEPRPNWINKFSRDCAKWIRECEKLSFGKMFRSPTDEYAVFVKTGSPCRCIFYGTFKVDDIKKDGMECLYKRLKTEIDPVKWVLQSLCSN